MSRRPKRKRACPELVALLGELHEAAKAGDITDIFIVLRDHDGEHDSCYQTNDLGDMLLQVRTEVIRAQAPVEMIRGATH